jgi:hypothetical protein
MSGETLITWQNDVTMLTIRQLGFVLEAQDLMQLGMNGYQLTGDNGTNSGEVDYVNYIDFSDYVPKSLIETQDFKDLAKKYFTVVYSIQRKTIKTAEDGTQTIAYVPYTGDAVKLYLNDTDTVSDTPVQAVSFHYDTEMIKKGNSKKGDSIMEYQYTLKADVEKLLQDADTITNYKVVATLYITSAPPTGLTAADYTDKIGKPIIVPSVSDFLSDESSQKAETLKDYFIFTAAKLKTDLDLAQ